jgi:hypothetical protein
VTFGAGTGDVGQLAGQSVQVFTVSPNVWVGKPVNTNIPPGGPKQWCVGVTCAFGGFQISIGRALFEVDPCHPGASLVEGLASGSGIGLDCDNKTFTANLTAELGYTGGVTATVQG